MESSLEDYTKALSLNGENGVIYSNRGMVLRKLNEYEKAIKDFTSELKVGSENRIKALNNRAFCYAKLSDYPKAIKNYTQVIQSEKDNIHALHNRGISYERLRKYKNVYMWIYKYIYIYILYMDNYIYALYVSLFRPLQILLK